MHHFTVVTTGYLNIFVVCTLHQHWPNGIKSARTFCPHPLNIATLPRSLADVIASGNSEYVFVGVFDGYIFSTLANDDSHFGFIVQVAGFSRPHDWIFRANYRTGRNDKETGELGGIAADVATKIKCRHEHQSRVNRCFEFDVFALHFFASVHQAVIGRVG